MRSCRFAVLAVLALTALASTARADTGARRHLGLDDFGAVHQPWSLRVSPDGSRVSFVFDDRLYLATGAGPPRAVTAKAIGVSGSRWSADGRSIYFLSERDAGTQVYRLPLDPPGEAVQVSHFEHGVASLNLSPDETRVLLAISDDELRDPPDEPEPIVVTRRHFKRDAGHGYITDGTLNHLYVFDIATRAMRQVTSGPWDNGEADWSPDGREVVFTSNRQADPDSDYRTDLFVVDVAGDGEPQLRRLTDDAHTKTSPAWSPDGRQIAYLSAEDGVFAINRIALIPADGGEPRFLTADFDRSISSFSYAPDGEWIWFDYPDSGTVRLGRVSVDDGRVETLVDGERVVVTFDVGASGDIALVMQVT